VLAVKNDLRKEVKIEAQCEVKYSIPLVAAIWNRAGVLALY
jgi:hypothetical protein